MELEDDIKLNDNIEFFKKFCNTLKTDMLSKNYIRPVTLFEFDVDSIYIWHLLPFIRCYISKWDFSLYVNFLCFQLRIHLCLNSFKYSSVDSFGFTLLPYIVYQKYQRKEWPNQIEIVFYKWFYRYCFGKIKPDKIIKYYRTNKFIKSFDETV